MRQWIAANLLMIVVLPTGLAYADDDPSTVSDILTKWEQAAAETRKPGRLDREHLLRVGGPEHSAHEIDAVLNFSGPVDANELTERFRWTRVSEDDDTVRLSAEPSDPVDSLFFSRVEVVFLADNPLPVGVEFFDLAGQPKRQSISVVCRWRSDASPLTPGNNATPVMVAENEPGLLRVAEAKPIPKKPAVDPRVREILDAWAVKHRKRMVGWGSFSDDEPNDVRKPRYDPRFGPRLFKQGQIVLASAEAIAATPNILPIPVSTFRPIPVYAQPDEVLANFQIDVLAENEELAELEWRLLSPDSNVTYPKMRTLLDLKTFRVIEVNYYDADGELKEFQRYSSSNDHSRVRTLLFRWWQASQNVPAPKITFHRFVYDKVFRREFRGQGEIQFDSPALATYEVRPVDVTDRTSRRRKQSGQPWELVPERAITLQFRAGEMWDVTDPSQEYLMSTEGCRPNEHSFWSFFTGKNPKHLPAVAAKVPDFLPLAAVLPIYLNGDLHKVLREYDVTLVKDEEKQASLKFVPRTQFLSLSILEFSVILDFQTNLPKACQIVDPSGNLETVHTFEYQP